MEYRIDGARHGLTGREHLALEPLPELPPVGGDILAVPAATAKRLGRLLS